MANLANDTARELLDVTMMLMRGLASRLRQGDLRLAPGHIGMLAKIGERPCSLSDLALHQAVRLPTISRSVSLLVERGLVHRWIPEENRRQTMVELTADGRRLLGRMKREAEAHTTALLAPLTEPERKQVHAALTILSRALAPRNARCAADPAGSPSRDYKAPARRSRRGSKAEAPR